MKRVLITGMSGTGKSTVIAALSALGYKAVDTDDDWPRWVMPVPDSEAADPGSAALDWVWREDRMQQLLSTEDTDLLFVSGCRTNQGKFYPQFDHVILLTAPPALIAERLRTRTTNSYGKDPMELAAALRFKETVEPGLRASASLEIDTGTPVEDVLMPMLDAVQPDRHQGRGGGEIRGDAGGRRSER